MDFTHKHSDRKDVFTLADGLFKRKIIELRMEQRKGGHDKVPRCQGAGSWLGTSGVVSTMLSSELILHLDPS